MNVSDVTSLEEMPVWLRLAFYLIDNVFVAIMVGIAVYLVQRRIDLWRERSARRVASDQFVAAKIQPLMDVLHENIPLIGTLAARSGSLTYEDSCRFGDCHQRQADEVERLQTASEFNAAAFEPYRKELDAVVKAMDELVSLVARAKANGTEPNLDEYLTLESNLRNASKALSNKSSVAVHAR